MQPLFPRIPGEPEGNGRARIPSSRLMVTFGMPGSIFPARAFLLKLVLCIV
jgi:hypothetical protein